ncbi:MAG: alpha-hydroxy-acid oxidizing protein [Clostridia bacterium]|nr:alpha-hydroxy-acid oxidizing protein [Clostridia bacterium]
MSETKKPLTWKEVCDVARGDMRTCKVCRECNGEACRGVMPGPGGKGTGIGFVRSYQKLQEIKLHLDTIYDHKETDTSATLFGRTFSAPVFVAPLAGCQNQYGPKYQNQEFGRALLRSTSADNLLTWLPDGGNDLFSDTCTLMKEFPGQAVPTIKPWPVEVMIDKFKRCEEAGAFAIATDLDGAGLALVQGGAVPVQPHTIRDLERLCASVKLPVIIKGVMTPKGAKKCLEAGAAGIVVSNHGGRVLEQSPAPVEMLAAIVAEVGDKMTILMDGAVRTGSDLFKIRAMGGHGALIGRPYAIAVYGGDSEGVSCYSNKLKFELREAMMMTGANTIDEIQKEILFLPDWAK